MKEATFAAIRHERLISLTVTHGMGDHALPHCSTVPSETEGEEGRGSRVLLLNNRVLAAVLEQRESRPLLLPTIEVSHPADNDVLVCPYGGQPVRDYPTGHWIALLSDLTARISFRRLWLLVTPEMEARVAKELGQPLKSTMQTEVQVISAANVRGIEAIVARVRLVVSVETSIAHIAVAMNKPTVVITGGGHYGVFGPWWRSRRQRWITNPLPCFNCEWQCKLDRPRCITDVLPSQVVDECIKALQTVSSETRVR
jgi:ADP-heptose:LPS heptosyltransferase